MGLEANSNGNLEEDVFWQTSQDQSLRMGRTLMRLRGQSRAADEPDQAARVPAPGKAWLDATAQVCKRLENVIFIRTMGLDVCWLGTG